MLDSACGNGNQGGGNSYSKPAQSSKPAPTGYSTLKPSAEQGRKFNAAGEELDELDNVKDSIPF